MMKRVLIVDDDPIYVETAQALLGSILSTQAASASNGMAAKALLDDAGPFDLLLLDLNMPEFDGVEFLEYLRQTGFRGAIIIVSAADKSVQNAATELGRANGLNVVACISKPLTVQNLVRALAHA